MAFRVFLPYIEDDDLAAGLGSANHFPGGPNGATNATLDDFLKSETGRIELGTVSSPNRDFPNLPVFLSIPNSLNKPKDKLLDGAIVCSF